MPGDVVPAARAAHRGIPEGLIGARSQRVRFRGELLTARGDLDIPGAAAPLVRVSALGPKMVELADGTITWMVGPQTLIELTVPTVRAAAAATGRPEAEVVVCAPACLTVDPDGARAAAQQVLGWYDGMPTYWAMIEREELSGAAELALVGDEASIRRQIDSYADAGATTFAIQPFGTPPEREATRRLVWTLASQAH